MADIELLKRLAEAVREDNAAYGDPDCYAPNLGLSGVESEFATAANPAAVLALIAENEALRSSSGFNELALLRMGFRQACEERDQLKAELERARAEAEALRKHLAECADSLESEILDRFGSSKDHPAMRRKFEFEMRDVIEARAAMGKGGRADG